jgi:hypothetical protein
VNVLALFGRGGRVDRRAGVSLKVLDLRRQTAICDGAALVLSRPDQHVAWRGVALRLIRWR